MEADSEYQYCMLRAYPDHECEGRITMEHAILHSGKRLQKKWAIVAICARAHEVDEFQDAGTMDKDLNIWCALNRATDSELKEISKCKDWIRERDRLNDVYGDYKLADNLY